MSSTRCGSTALWRLPLSVRQARSFPPCRRRSAASGWTSNLAHAGTLPAPSRNLFPSELHCRSTSLPCNQCLQPAITAHYRCNRHAINSSCQRHGKERRCESCHFGCRNARCNWPTSPNLRRRRPFLESTLTPCRRASPDDEHRKRVRIAGQSPTPAHSLSPTLAAFTASVHLHLRAPPSGSCQQRSGTRNVKT